MDHEALTMPVVFVSHGAPTLALDREKGADFARVAQALPRPRSILVISAHWEQTPVLIGTTEPEGLLHDFGGFDEALYRINYTAPGAPELAGRVSRLLGGPRREDVRMWDHGVWVPLLHMYPDADLPVLQVSLPSGGGSEEVYELGRRLAPLRDEGVLLLASGGLVHNLRRIDWQDASEPEPWAEAFEQWARERLEAGDTEAFLQLEEHAPDLRTAHPTLEHILPLVAAVGAAGPEFEASFPIEGFEYGNLSRTAVRFG